ncbi:MAG: rhodanese-like domain-containing protein [Cyclobacteriaceae bacterium]|nr:rhodanese-like domain-containing protein [Cyclobacteriaceae bacterium]MDX5467292.1 rhodanese-like domain-containing protein [Cyclobacteriaceae bacterium]
MTKFLSTVLLGTMLFSACSNSKKESQATEVTTPSATLISLNPEEFSQKSGNGIILDVRTPEEIAQGKIPGSQGLDFYQSNFLEKASEFPKDSEIFIYCAVGARSQEAANLMISQGYTKVYHLQGGIQAWQRSGYPIE